MIATWCILWKIQGKTQENNKMITIYNENNIALTTEPKEVASIIGNYLPSLVTNKLNSDFDGQYSIKCSVSKIRITNSFYYEFVTDLDVQNSVKSVLVNNHAVLIRFL